VSTRRPEDFARQFPENGMKLLLQRAENLRDLLHIVRLSLVDRLDFARLETDPTTYVQRDYRHLESDLVLRVPLKGRKRSLLVYILLEHQSEPDVFMVFRVLDYVVSILRSQVRAWLQDHPTLHDFRFQPVLPIVFYTGSRPWPDLGLLLDLFEDLTALPELSRRLPRIEPLFINLRETPAKQLVAEGGPFGQVLRLFQGRQAGQTDFGDLLEQVVAALEELSKSSLVRWQELMSYLHALVYHERGESEHAALHQRIEQKVQTQRRREEVSKMKKTIADMYREEGAEQATLATSRRKLLRLLERRFGVTPADIVQIILACQTHKQLDEWFDKAATARSLKAVGIEAAS
jgi:hypothetical protein